MLFKSKKLENCSCLKSNETLNRLKLTISGALLGAAPLVSNVAFAAGPNIEDISNMVFGGIAIVIGILGVLFFGFAIYLFFIAKFNGDSQSDTNKMKNFFLWGILAIIAAGMVFAKKATFAGWIQSFADQAI